MKMFPALENKYSKENMSAFQAQRMAHEIAFGPVVFQVSRLMIKFGIFQMLVDSEKGMTMDEVAEKAGLSRYAAQVLLEASLTIGTVIFRNERFELSKTGWFLLNDESVRANIDFNHDVNYIGWFKLEEALLNGKPEGLRYFGDWDTIYEGLSKLPKDAQKSWFGFDHFYSDLSFDEALKIVFSYPIRTLLDVGGNTGRWALRCVDFNSNVKVTILDLPQQLELMKENIKGKNGCERISGHGGNLLDNSVPFPENFDAIWMSQFLDCFSEDEITSILKRAAASMNINSSLFIMETFWDRQRFETSAFILTQVSLYFTALANGNSKMYHSDDMIRCVEAAGLTVEKIYDDLGRGGHSILVCKKIDN